jgi:hypothetical protein
VFSELRTLSRSILFLLTTDEPYRRPKQNPCSKSFLGVGQEKPLKFRSGRRNIRLAGVSGNKKRAG